MNKKDITQKLINNSKLIYELGGRIGVCISDWMLDDTGEVSILIRLNISDEIAEFVSDISEKFSDEFNSFIPIWSSRKCKQWLMERGYSGLSYFDASKNGWIFDLMSSEEVENLNFKATTEDEVCTEAVIKVLKEGK